MDEEQKLVAIEVIADSHVDHGLTGAQLAAVLVGGAPAGAVHTRTLMLPDELGDVPCSLYGPVMGDPAVLEKNVYYDNRPGRDKVSRLIAALPRVTKMVTVITGPHADKECVLYTVFGGPLAPREVSDSDSPDSKAFWAEHALVAL